MWNVVKAVLSGKFIACNAYIRKEEISRINNLIFHFRKLGKEQIKSKVRRRKKIVRITLDIKKSKWDFNREINETKSWLFEKINKIDTYLPRIIRKKRKDTNY